MKQEFKEPNWGLLGVVALAIGGTAYLLNRNNDHTDLGEDRSRILNWSGSRDRSGTESNSKVIVTKPEVSSPILSDKSLSKRSRSSSSYSRSNSRTSTNTGTESVPENIMKYPPHYYDLSKKAQWRYRKRLNQ